MTHYDFWNRVRNNFTWLQQNQQNIHHLHLITPKPYNIIKKLPYNHHHRTKSNPIEFSNCQICWLRTVIWQWLRGIKTITYSPWLIMIIVEVTRMLITVTKLTITLPIATITTNYTIHKNTFHYKCRITSVPRKVYL